MQYSVHSGLRTCSRTSILHKAKAESIAKYRRLDDGSGLGEPQGTVIHFSLPIY